MSKHKKIAQKCAVCGKEPAYYSKIAGNYVCLTHSIHFIKKAVIAAAVIGAVALFYFYS